MIFSRIGTLDKLLFTKHLSVMVKSGITISESLSILAEQTRSATFRRIIKRILLDIQNGQKFSAALSRYPKVFDQFYISMIDVAEESGLMDTNLEFLAQQLAKNYALKKKIQGAMLYPGIILSSTIIMGGFISFFILPKLTDLFSTFQVSLPLTTQILLFIANVMKQDGILILMGIGIISFLIILLYRIPVLRYRIHVFLLHAPIFGNLIQDSELAHFSRNLGTLLKSGIPIDAGLETTANTLTNLKFKNDLNAAAEEVAKGNNLSDFLKQKNQYEFPLLVTKMIEVGEKTGTLEEELLYLGDFYEEEIDDISKNLTTILEPILLLGIGLVVGFVAVAVIGPIYQLAGSIRR